jgi:hypothetical protein
VFCFAPRRWMGRCLRTPPPSASPLVSLAWDHNSRPSTRCARPYRPPISQPGGTFAHVAPPIDMRRHRLGSSVQRRAFLPHLGPLSWAQCVHATALQRRPSQCVWGLHDEDMCAAKERIQDAHESLAWFMWSPFGLRCLSVRVSCCLYQFDAPTHTHRATAPTTRRRTDVRVRLANSRMAPARERQTWRRPHRADEPS